MEIPKIFYSFKLNFVYLFSFCFLMHGQNSRHEIQVALLCSEINSLNFDSTQKTAFLLNILTSQQRIKNFAKIFFLNAQGRSSRFLEAFKLCVVS